MEEFQEIESPQKMGSVVLAKIVRGLPVHGPDGEQRKGYRRIQRRVPAGHLLGPKIGAS